MGRNAEHDFLATIRDKINGTEAAFAASMHWSGNNPIESLLWSSQRVSTGSGGGETIPSTVEDFMKHLNQTFMEVIQHTFSMAQLRGLREKAVAQHDMTSTSVQSAKDAINRSCYVASIVAPLLALFCFWFVYAGMLAYRKAALELIFSIPVFRYHPQFHDSIQDKKLISTIALSFIAGYLFLLVICILFGLVV